MKRPIGRIATLAASLAAALLLFAPAVVGQDRPGGPVLRESDPPFRTDLGVHISLGGNSCVGGGTNYAACKGADYAWDTGFGMAGGLLVRPLSWLSTGIDVAYGMMILHQETGSRWSDLQVGPTLRGHIPVRIRSLYMEPNIGVQIGWVRGNYHQAKREDTRDTVDYDHTHIGAFVAMMAGVDFFLLPKLALGIELRVLRTFYDEICFEAADGKSCRGPDDEAVVERYADNQSYPGERGLADYPWKLFWGVHGLYYF